MLSLITGAGRKGQVGEAVARALAARGDVVLVVDRDAEVARARASEIVAAGYRAHGYACDLSDEAQVDRLAAAVRQDHGDRLDALVNLAGGFAASGSLAESDPAVFQRMLDINLRTAYLTTRGCLPMLRNARGCVVYVASEVVLVGTGTRGVAGYAAAKAAIVALMRSVADEGADHGVRANALAPGAIRTAANEAGMGPGTRYVEREEVASAIAFLCSGAAAAITGQTIRLSAVTR